MSEENPFYDPEYLRTGRQTHKRPAGYKTRMCRRVLGGRACPRGSRCRYAHSREELKPPDSRNLYAKTRICRYIYDKKACPLGERCPFAHSIEERRPPVPVRRKRRPCMMYFQDGFCAFGERCFYLHDPEKVRPALTRPITASGRKRLPIFEALATVKEK